MAGCNTPMEVYVPKDKWNYKPITVHCGNTSHTGYPYFCYKCTKKYKNVDWKREAIEAGETWDEDGW